MHATNAAFVLATAVEPVPTVGAPLSAALALATSASAFATKAPVAVAAVSDSAPAAFAHAAISSDSAAHAPADATAFAYVFVAPATATALSVPPPRRLRAPPRLQQPTIGCRSSTLPFMPLFCMHAFTSPFGLPARGSRLLHALRRHETSPSYMLPPPCLPFRHCRACSCRLRRVSTCSRLRNAPLTGVRRF